MIVFQNSGLIDMLTTTTMGVSVKDGEGAIGHFGTGLKFAIATILRNGGGITIYRGLCPHEFGTIKDIVRDEEFEFITLDGQRLGYTTMLGRDWKPWMAFRELASNCRDEGGEYRRYQGDEGSNLHLSDCTTIAVHGLDDVWADRHSIMLESRPLESNEHIEVHEGVSQHIYYRGVRVYDAPRPLAYTYNLREKIELTEDRTAKNWYEVEMKLERGIGKLDNRQMLRRILTCGESYGEHHMNVPKYGNPGPMFRELARELALGHAAENNANPAAIAMARQSAIQDMKEGDGATLTTVQTRMMQKAILMLSGAGFNIGEFPVIVCDTLGPNIHGMAKDGRIFMSLLPFAKGTREVAATLLEEYAHLKSGASDCTREFQNWLFDRLLMQAENEAGEPF